MIQTLIATLILQGTAIALPSGQTVEQLAETLAREVPHGETKGWIVSGATANGRTITIHLGTSASSDVSAAVAMLQNAGLVSSYCHSTYRSALESGVELVFQLTTAGRLLGQRKITYQHCLGGNGMQLEQRFDDLTRETEAYKRAVDLANSPQGKMCDAYVGRSITPLSFGGVAAKYPDIKPKGEYETTAAYNERRKSSHSGAGEILVVSVPSDRDYLEYNADERELQIGGEAFGTLGYPDDTATGMFASLALDEAGVKSSIGSDNLVITVASSQKVTGSYTAHNALGASWKVQQLTVTTKAIFDREIERGRRLGSGILFPIAVATSGIAGTIAASPAEARALKKSLRAALVVQPRPPYLVRYTSTDIPKATFADPREATEKLEILTADIQCGLVLNEQGKVLGAYPTN